MPIKTRTIIIAIVLLALGTIGVNYILLFISFFNESWMTKLYLVLILIGYAIIVSFIFTSKKIVFPQWFKIAYIPLTILIFGFFVWSPYKHTVTCPDQFQQISNGTSSAVLTELRHEYYFWEGRFWSGESDVARCEEQFNAFKESVKSNPPPQN
jgi:hypothetical protein